jgi:hypothetical protein
MICNDNLRYDVLPFLDACTLAKIRLVSRFFADACWQAPNHYTNFDDTVLARCKFVASEPRPLERDLASCESQTDFVHFLAKNANHDLVVKCFRTALLCGSLSLASKIRKLGVNVSKVLLEPDVRVFVVRRWYWKFLGNFWEHGIPLLSPERLFSFDVGSVDAFFVPRPTLLVETAISTEPNARCQRRGVLWACAGNKILRQAAEQATNNNTTQAQEDRLLLCAASALAGDFASCCRLLCDFPPSFARRLLAILASEDCEPQTFMSVLQKCRSRSVEPNNIYEVASKAAVHSPRILKHLLPSEERRVRAGAVEGFECLLAQDIEKFANFDDYSHEHLQMCVDTLAKSKSKHKADVLSNAINAQHETERAKARISLSPQHEHKIIARCSPDGAVSLVREINVAVLPLLLRCMQEDAVEVFRALIAGCRRHRTRSPIASRWRPDKDVKVVLLHRARSLENKVFVKMLNGDV